ncbi:hypothetical protein PAPYR_10815 [Paratrimastix pyriformis]|uniref:Uncharacterized protein n=1 Tax=Paratrimastix pyriformis TaxID=342808 RepID=A0ABQ8U545_9EUKA|nr:hypothetical protein PAPYR_10815 [Paratrimastix pyriformis]
MPNQSVGYVPSTSYPLDAEPPQSTQISLCLHQLLIIRDASSSCDFLHHTWVLLHSRDISFPARNQPDAHHNVKLWRTTLVNQPMGAGMVSEPEERGMPLLVQTNKFALTSMPRISITILAACPVHFS